MPTDERRLWAFALGTFHAALLMVGVVALLHARGGVDALQSLGTLVGLALFALLWGLSILAAWRTLVKASPFGPWQEIVPPAAFWGGVAGTAFAGTALLVGLLASGALAGLPFALLAAAFAFLPGAGIGALFALLDRALLVTAEQAAPQPPADRRGGDPP